MAAPLAKIRFALRQGGSIADFGGTWAYFDTNFGCIEDWSGLLSEGPIGGDIIQQDWVDGAIWQEGPNKTYSFDVPFTVLVSDPIDPNIHDALTGGIFRLKQYRGPLLTMRRDFYDNSGLLDRRDQALGVLVTDLALKVSIGRIISTVAVFQNLSGGWPIGQDLGGPV